MSKKTVMAILVDHRTKAAVKVQEILTKNGCIISGRFGIHEVSDEKCADEGLIILTLSGSKSEADAMAKTLKDVEGVKVNTMEI